MPVITEEYLDSLAEEDIIFIRDYIWRCFGKEPNKNEHTVKPVEQMAVPVRDIKPSDVPPCCPHCGGTRFIKYGSKDGKQRYFCKDCNKSFLEDSGTLMASCRLTEDQIRELIDCEVEGLSLKEEAHTCRNDDAPPDGRMRVFERDFVLVCFHSFSFPVTCLFCAQRSVLLCGVFVKSEKSHGGEIENEKKPGEHAVIQHSRKDSDQRICRKEPWNCFSVSG